jgi:hypothetical protein
VKVDPPVSGDNVSDLTRVINALRRQYDLHNIHVDFKAIKTLPT